MSTICSLCHGSGNILCSHDGVLEFWQCPACGGAGARIMWAPPKIFIKNFNVTNGGGDAIVKLSRGIGVLTAFVTAGLTKSNSDSRRQIQGKALRINDQLVTDENKILNENGQFKLSFGKKRHVLCQIN